MAGPGAKPKGDIQPKLRLDKWLWAARFFKTRDLAAEVIESGHLRINGQRCRKSGHGVLVGDVLTFSQARAVRVIRVLELDGIRGPASQAQMLYHDLAPTPDAPLE